MLIDFDDRWITFALLNGYRNDLIGKTACPNCGLGPLLAAKCQLILVIARNTEFVGNIFSGFGHRVDAVLLFELAIDKTPTECRVEHFRISSERSRLFAQHERCA